MQSVSFAAYIPWHTYFDVDCRFVMPAPLLQAFNLLNSGLGRSIILCIVLAALLAVMATDRRSLAEYGLAVRPGWWRHWMLGFAVGTGVYIAYCCAAWSCGVFQLHTADLSPYRWLSASLAACCALPVAATQQVIFSGYLLTKFRECMGRTGAVYVSAALFAALAVLGGDSSKWMSAESASLACGMFLIAALLGGLRLVSGNILLPVGVLTGAIVVRRLIKKTHLLAFQEEHAWASWFAPHGDPRQGVWFWAIVACGLAGVWIVMLRRGEPKHSDNEQLLTASFKRVFPFSNVMAMAPLDLWWSSLVDARFRVGIQYVPRLIWILAISAVNTLLSLPERWLAPYLLRHRVADPVFVVGVHRSGTTHLHNLMALDPQYCTPRNFHTMNPFGALVTGWLITPLLGMFMTMKRPMDAMRISMLTPQEDEFGIAGMGRLSPYWAFTFPRRVDKYERYIQPAQWSDAERDRWKRQLTLFLRKVTFWSRKRPLLKSPYHTGRVQILRNLFGSAKFVHIVRHPYDVFRSNQHLAREGLITFQLQDPDPDDCFQTRFVTNYRMLMERFYNDARDLPWGDVVEVRFEDLEENPLREIRRIYRELGMEFSAFYEQRLNRYLESVAGHRKNRFAELLVEEQEQLDAQLGSFMRRWGYSNPTGDLSTPANISPAA